MAQNQQATGGQKRQLVTAENIGTPVGSTATVILEVTALHGCEEMGAQINPITQSFNAFVIEGKFHPSGDYVTLYNSGFATPTGLLIGTSGDLAAQGAGTTGWFIMNVRSLIAVRLKASSVAGTGTATVRSGASGQ